VNKINFDDLRQIHLDFHTPAFVKVGEKFDAVEMFDRYGFRAIPVVDDNKRIVGVLQYKDTIKLQQRGIE
jgi:Mg/Co/Ni transporter MgtE